MFVLRTIFTTALAVGIVTSVTAVPPPDSPGLPIGQTSWDEQQVHSMGHQTARISNADIVHFVWTSWDRIPEHADELDRWGAYCSLRTSGGWFWGCDGTGGWGGQFISFGVSAQAGYLNVSVKPNNCAQITMQQHSDPSFPPTIWRLNLPIPGSNLHVDDEMPLGTSSEFRYPRIATERDSNAINISHIIASIGLSSENLVYWRFNGTNWDGPALIDSTPTSGYVIACDATSGRVAIVLHSPASEMPAAPRNIAYYESQTSGLGWINGSELGAANKQILTGYTNASGPQAFVHIATSYDHDGVLHIVWDEEQSVGSTKAMIRHWNSQRQTIRPVASGLWEAAWNPGVNSLNLSKLSLGIGDGGTPCSGIGTNENILYVVYTRFGGPTAAEEADHSVSGYYNGELYLNSSADGGNTWSQPLNLTNTKTPNCRPGPADTMTGIPERPDSVCRSEHWASIGEVVDDIDILFISDKDAGSIPYGEGTWQLNPVQYLRFPGGTINAPKLCPVMGPAMAASVSGGDSCGFHAQQSGADTGQFVLINSGNANLTGTISISDFPGAATLSLTTVGPFTIPAGGPDLTSIVTMSANGAAMDTYAGQISISHNDASLPNPLVINVSFNVGLCQCHGDPVCDGSTNIQDVVKVIERAFRGIDGMYDPPCPDGSPSVDGRTDVDCVGGTNVVDVVLMVNVAFRGASKATEFCHLCP